MPGNNTNTVWDVLVHRAHKQRSKRAKRQGAENREQEREKGRNGERQRGEKNTQAEKQQRNCGDATTTQETQTRKHTNKHTSRTRKYLDTHGQHPGTHVHTDRNRCVRHTLQLQTQNVGGLQLHELFCWKVGANLSCCFTSFCTWAACGNLRTLPGAVQQLRHQVSPVICQTCVKSFVRWSLKWSIHHLAK